MNMHGGTLGKTKSIKFKFYLGHFNMFEPLICYKLRSFINKNICFID